VTSRENPVVNEGPESETQDHPVFLNTRSCMSVRYSTPHVHYLQLNPSRVCLPTNFQKFKCHIFICVCPESETQDHPV
jgi:hypothetical protein